jgi:hypothetical protein
MTLRVQVRTDRQKSMVGTAKAGCGALRMTYAWASSARKAALFACVSLGISACTSSVDRTLFGPDVPETTKAAEVARQKDYPNVFAEPSKRPPLLSPAEQAAAKSQLEQGRGASKASGTN